MPFTTPDSMADRVESPSSVGFSCCGNEQSGRVSVKRFSARKRVSAPGEMLPPRYSPKD